MTALIVIGVLMLLGAAAVGYFVLWMKTWGERAWAGPNASEVPLWRWLVLKVLRCIRGEQ